MTLVISINLLIYLLCEHGLATRKTEGALCVPPFMTIFVCQTITTTVAICN